MVGGSRASLVIWEFTLVYTCTNCGRESETRSLDVWRSGTLEIANYDLEVAIRSNQVEYLNDMGIFGGATWDQDVLLDTFRHCIGMGNYALGSDTVEPECMAPTYGDDGSGTGTTTGDSTTRTFETGYDVSPFDWLLPQPAGKRPCTNVTLEDVRPSAALAILYLWSWGDGTTTVTTAPTANHTYAEEKVYKITVRVQYRNGAIDIFVIHVDTRGLNCSVSEFIQEIFPILLGLVGLALLSSIIVTASRRSKTAKKRLNTLFLVVAIGALVVVILVGLYAAILGIP
jgi:hypothetical protein